MGGSVMMSQKYEKYMIEIPLVPEVAAKIMQINEGKTEIMIF